MHKPTILMVTTGGTIASQFTEYASRYKPNVKGEDLLNQLTAKLPSKQRKYYHYQLSSPMQIDSKNLKINDLFIIHQAIVQALNENTDIQGIVLSCGTDNLEAIAFFLDLSQYLQGLKKPIVITGAMLPNNHLDFDGLTNLKNATLFLDELITQSEHHSTHDSHLIGGVFVCFNQQLILPLQVLKKDAQAITAFNTDKYIGKIGLWNKIFGTVTLNKTFNSAYSKTTKFLLGNIEPTYNQLLASIFHKALPLITCFEVDLENKFLQQNLDELSQNYALIILNGLGNGSIPDAYQPYMDELYSKGVKIIRTSQAIMGNVDHQPQENTLAAYGLSKTKLYIFLAAYLSNLLYADLQKQYDLSDTTQINDLLENLSIDITDLHSKIDAKYLQSMLSLFIR